MLLNTEYGALFFSSAFVAIQGKEIYGNKKIGKHTKKGGENNEYTFRFERLCNIREGQKIYVN